MRQSHAVHIDRPVSTVFAFAEDPDNAPRWAEGIERFEILEGQAGEVGARYEMDVREGGSVTTYEGELIAWERDERTVNRVDAGGGSTMTMTRDYEPTETGTRLTMTVEVELSGLAKLMLPLVWWMNRSQLKSQAEALKALVEAETEPPVQAAGPPSG